MSRRTNLLTFGLLALCSQVAFTAPMPYDSIGNPLNNASSLDREVQRKGDLLNLVPNRVRVNQAGYRQRDVVLGLAQFYYVGTALTYSVVNDARVPVANGTLSPKGAVTVSGQINPTASNSAEHQTGGNGDWKTGYPMTGTLVSGPLMAGILPATLPAGRYRILVGADSSVPFIVSDNVYAMARDAALKFFGVARSGDYESWFHPNSHMWDGWLFDTTARNPDGTFTYKGALKGGWYDCGNHLKEARTISYPLAALGMLAATMPEKDADNYALNQGVARPQPTDGIPDVLREAWVGSQFVFNSWRLAKGKAADMILSVGDPGPDFGWWGRPENQDAVLSPRRGGRSERVLLKNWGSGSMGDFAAGLAFTSRKYRVYSPSFADSALTIAKAMYETAKTTNRKETAPDYAGDAVLYDDLALAAVALLWATGDTKYLKEIAYTAGMPNGSGAVCAPSGFGQGFETTRFQGGFFGCGSDGMKKNGGPTDYGSVNTLALYSFAKLILVNADTAKNYGITAAQRDTLLLRTINQTPGPTWGQLGNAFFTIPVGGQYDQPIRLSYDSIWYAMGQGYGKTGWWNKYQFGNLADLYMYYDMSSLVDGRAILDKPGNTDWKRKEVLRVLLGGLNYMFGTNALDLSYLYGIGRKNPMHPHHRSSNPEGKNVPGAYYYYQIPVGGLYGGLMTGPTNSEVLREYFDTPVGQTEANCPDAQAVVMIPLMGLASEAPVGPPMPTVKVLYTTDTLAVVQVDLDKWGWVLLGIGADSALATQTRILPGNDTGNVIRVAIGGLKPGTQYFFHVVSTDLGGLSSKVSKWPNGLKDSIPFSFVTKPVPPVPPLYGNIKVCNVTSDSAEVLWATPNGEYFSSVMWADSASWKANRFNVTDSDAVGNVPVRFHRVKLKGLKPKTTYYFKVGTQGAYNAMEGCFRTPNEDVKFDIRTTHYTWGGKPAMGISVLNQNEKLFDSLQIRLYVNGTRAELLDLAARVDIAFKYRSDAFIDSGLFAYTKNVSKSRPKLIDPTCPAATQSCAWYFDLPMYGATMDPLARWRLDVVFDRHLLARDTTEILDQPPTHDPFAVGGQDWSMRAHVAGSDNGLSPVDYAGVPAMGKEDIDNKTQDIPVNPYIAVYRRNEFVYGFSPSAVEQKTKRTVFAMDASFDKPFDLPFGNTIEIGTGTSTTLKGTLNPYDVMIPQSKGYINTIWVNGTALTNAERRAALTRQADGTWKVALPLRFVTGTNKVDVTFFASADSTDTLDATGCSEGKGCAFYNAHWYVNYVSNLTTSVLQVVDAADRALGLVAPDSSRLIVRVKDGNANLAKTAVDQVSVVATNRRTGLGFPLVLTETGLNTGVFQTATLSVVSAAAAAGQIQMAPGDTLDLRYQDASDAADSSTARIWATSAWPSLVSGSVVAGCGSNHVSARLDKALGAGLVPSGIQLLLNAAFEDKVPKTEGEFYNYSGTLAGWTVQHVDIVNGSIATSLSAAQGILSLDLNDENPGWIGQRVATTTGGSVRLSLKYSANLGKSSTSPDTKLAVVLWNGVAIDTLVWDAVAEPIRSWKSATWDLRTTGSDSILIRSLIAGNAGIMVDDISLKGLTQSTTSVRDSILSGTLVLTDAVGTPIQQSALAPADITVLASGVDLLVQPAIPTVAGVTGGTLELLIRTIAGKLTTTRIVLTDSVGPWIDSAKIVENVEGRAVDTLLVWTSEPTLFAAKTFPVVLTRAGVAASTAGIVVDSSWLSDPATGKWTFLLRGGVVQARDFIRWKPVGADFSSLVGNMVAGERIVFRGAVGPAAPQIRDSLVVERTGASWTTSIHFNDRPAETTTGMTLQAGRLTGYNTQKGYDFWIQLDSVKGLAFEWYRYPAIGLLGPNQWGNMAYHRFDGSVTTATASVPAAASVTDAHGIPALDCPTMAREVKLISRPAPFSRAWILDTDGDSRADQVRMVFRKLLVAKDLPDSVEVRFGTGTERRSAVVSMLDATDSNLVIRVPAFAFGSTIGSGPDGSGTLILWKSASPNGPYPLSDSVGPAVVSAGLVYGSVVDTLDLVFSEPVGKGGGVGWITSRPATELGTLYLPDSVQPSRWRLPVVQGSVFPGDSVRMGPTSRWTEAHFRKAGASHPWIPVTGGERAPVGGWYNDVDGDGRVDQATVVFALAPRTRPAFSLWWPNAAGGLDSASIGADTWEPGPDGKTLTIPVGPFAKGVTSASTTVLGKWMSPTERWFAMNDSVPPVLVSAVFRYGATESHPDTLRVRWSELSTVDIAGNFLRHKSRGAEAPILPIQYQPDLDGMGGFLTLRPDTVQLRKGDSASFQLGSAFDRFFARVGARSPYVPVVFGPRPSRVDFRLKPYMELPAPTSRPGDAFQIWVRGRGEDVWVDCDSVPVADTLTSWIGATLTMNRVQEGSAYIYDNAGTFVATANLDRLIAMAASEKLPMDGSETFQLRLSWDGRSTRGKFVGSGPYVMRLLLKDADPENPRGLPVITNRVYKLGIKRSTK
ncbi:MAG: glycoside hydrolase family 9 protein [Fibrobacteres bacterium]|nr:glycoside hydrolase family 9 protein [Fibrobacterota bacterium]